MDDYGRPLDPGGDTSNPRNDEGIEIFSLLSSLKLHCPICPSIEVILDWVKTFCLN